MNNRITMKCSRLLCFFSLIFAVLPASTATAVQYRVLFLGNSYTQVNDLPAMINSLAVSTGDQVVYSTNMPGGYTFQQHSADPASLGLIMQGNWDYVVLQEQSQRPSFPDEQVAAEVYPYARTLDSLVKAYNPCVRTVFYMTWGRKNGDPQNCPFFSPLCTYRGMDSLLQLRYTIMAEDNNAVISPVAKVWRSLRTEQPSLELYNADESHPSVAGTYAAACSFYSILFRKDPMLCSFNASLSVANAATIKSTAKLIVFDSLDHWYRFDEIPPAGFTYQVNGNTASFSSSITTATAFSWNFGDGGTATQANPVHTYAAAGNYQVSLAITRCGRTDTIRKAVTVGTTGIQGTAADAGISIFPNPAGDQLYIESGVLLQRIRVYDLSGRTVLQLPVGQHATTLDIHALRPGIYYVTAGTGDGNLHYRFRKL